MVEGLAFAKRLYFRVWQSFVEESATFIRNYALAMENLRSNDEVVLSCLGVTSVPVQRQDSRGITSDAGSSECELHAWRPPEQDWLKLNTDASFLPESGETWWAPSFAAVTARPLFLHGGRHLAAHLPWRLKLLPVWKALKGTSGVPGAKIDLESDCQILVNNLQNGM